MSDACLQPVRAKTLTTVSVLIPTYNRPLMLAKALSHVRAQTYRDYEIIVVDDASADASTRNVCALFGASYFRLETNQGVIGAHNFGISKCVGRYILNLDDDSWPASPSCMADCVEFMDANAGVAVLALNVRSPQRPPQWPPSLKPFKAPYYSGCAAVFRRAAILTVGPNIRESRRQGEESDRSLRLYSAGLPIVALPGVDIVHEVSELNRDRRRHVAREALNFLTRELVRAPLALVPYGVVRALAFAARNWRSLDSAEYLAGLVDLEAGPVRLMGKYRSPVRLRSYVQWHFHRHLYSPHRMSIEKYSQRFAWPCARE